ncbi:MAG: cytochrome c biogenesis protein CcsA, partial [Verrucomicrobiota bacterium]
LVFVSWSAVLLYFLVGQAFRLSLMGVFTAPLVALFQGWALLHLSSETEYRPAEDYWLEMHASISLLAYGSFALAALAGVMFLLQNRLLRQGQIGSLSLSLPPVTNLSRSIPRIVGIGIILLTLGIASGFGMERPPTGIHLALSFSVWLLYLAFLALRFWGPLPNPRMAWCVIGAFLLPMLTLRFISH